MANTGQHTKGFLAAEDVIQKANESFENKNWQPVFEVQTAAVITHKPPVLISFLKKLFETKYVFLFREEDGTVSSAVSEKLADLSDPVFQATVTRKSIDEGLLELFSLFKEAPHMLERAVEHFAQSLAKESAGFLEGLRELKILCEKVRRRVDQYGVAPALSRAVTEVFKLESPILPVLEEDLIEFLNSHQPEPEGTFAFVENQLSSGVGGYTEGNLAILLSRLETMIRELQKYSRIYMPWLTIPDSLYLSFLEKGYKRVPALGQWLEGIKTARTNYGLSQIFWEQSRTWYFERISSVVLPGFQKSIAGLACWTIIEERQIKDPLSHAGETVRYSARRSEFKIRRDCEPDGIYALCSVDELIFTNKGLRRTSRDFPYENVSCEIRETKLSREAFLDSKDARFAGYTWKHLLPGGGPDKEIKNNERIECFIYYVVTVSSKGFGVPLIKLVFAKEENARLFADFLKEAQVLTSWKEYPQNGLPAPLKAIQKHKASCEESARVINNTSRTVQEAIVESINSIDKEFNRELERENEIMEEQEEESIAPELLEKIKKLHYELEWAIKRHSRVSLNYGFPEITRSEAEATSKPEEESTDAETSVFRELESKIEALSGKTLATVCRVLSSEPEREYKLEELGLTFWSIFVVAPKITADGKPLIEVISGETPRVVWGRHFDSETRDLLRARFALENR